MDLFKSSPFSAALPGIFTFVDESRSVEQTHHHASTQLEFQVPALQNGMIGSREMTRKQWESLKPLIERVYIFENRSFRYLANILREEHGFEPTKRQFSRKVDEWGFRKNVSRSERQTILQTLSESTSKSVPDLKDQRLKPGKLKNWRRKYRGEVAAVSHSLAKSSPGQAVSHQTTEFFSGAEDQIHQASDPGKNPSALPAHDHCENLAEESGAAPFDIVSMEMCKDAWPFNWSTVDVLESPGLSRLLNGLEIECANFIPPLSLDSTESDNPPCLSNLELQAISNNGRKKVIDNFSQLYPSKASKYFVSFDIASANQHPHYPWRDINTVYCGYCPSPLNDVYIFPQSRSTSRRPLNSKVALWESLAGQEAALELKLATLKKQFKFDIPAVVAAMEDLARFYNHSGQNRKEELMSRELVNVYLRTLGHNSLRTLEASHKVIKSIIAQGQYLKAQSLSQGLRSAVFELVQADHPLAVRTLDMEATLAENLENYETAEHLRRQLLQVRLSSFGARHPGTIYAMSKLGSAISIRNNGGEKLLQTAVQLSLEDPAKEETNGSMVMGNLAYLLQIKGAYDEAHCLITKALERLSLSLGPGYGDITRLQEQLAWNMFKQRNLIESEKLFRLLLSPHSNDEVGTSQGNISNLCCGLAQVRLEMGYIEEAIEWYAKSFHERLSRNGANYSVTIAVCYDLGNLYEKGRRYEDALELYRRLIDRIRETGTDPNGAIPELESEILRIEQQMEQSTSESSINFEESREYELDSDNEKADEGEDGEAEKQVAVEEGEEGELEKEDWMAFIHDFLTS